MERENGCVFLSSQVQLHEYEHKEDRALDLSLCFCHVSLTKAKRDRGVEYVCKGAVRMIDSGI